MMSTLATLTLLAAAPTYTVQPGDTCASIAQKLFGNPTAYDLIHQANELGPPPHNLKPGTVLRLQVDAAQADAKLTFLRPMVSTRHLLEWTPAVLDMDLFRLDEVHTLKGAGAELTFRDSSTLVLDENALVVVYGDGPSPQKPGTVTLVDGELRLALASLRAAPFVVAAGPVRVQGDGVQGTFETSAERTARLSVFDGRADVSAQGRSVHVKAGHGTRVLDGKAPEPARPLPGSPVVSGPSPRAEWWSEGGAQVTVAWSRPARGERYRLQVARDAKFIDRVADVRTSELSAQVGPLEPGRYRVRVIAFDAAGLQGRPSAIAEVQVARVPGCSGSQPCTLPFGARVDVEHGEGVTAQLEAGGPEAPAGDGSSAPGATTRSDAANLLPGGAAPGPRPDGSEGSSTGGVGGPRTTRDGGAADQLAGRAAPDGTPGTADGALTGGGRDRDATRGSTVGATDGGSTSGGADHPAALTPARVEAGPPGVVSSAGDAGAPGSSATTLKSSAPEHHAAASTAPPAQASRTQLLTEGLQPGAHVVVLRSGPMELARLSLVVAWPVPHVSVKPTAVGGTMRVAFDSVLAADEAPTATPGLTFTRVAPTAWETTGAAPGRYAVQWRAHPLGSFEVPAPAAPGVDAGSPVTPVAVEPSAPEPGLELVAASGSGPLAPPTAFTAPALAAQVDLALMPSEAVARATVSGTVDALKLTAAAQTTAWPRTAPGAGTFAGRVSAPVVDLGWAHTQAGLDFTAAPAQRLSGSLFVAASGARARWRWTVDQSLVGWSTAERGGLGWRGSLAGWYLAGAGVALGAQVVPELGEGAALTGALSLRATKSSHLDFGASVVGRVGLRPEASCLITVALH